MKKITLLSLIMLAISGTLVHVYAADDLDDLDALLNDMSSDTGSSQDNTGNSTQENNNTTTEENTETTQETEWANEEEDKSTEENADTTDQKVGKIQLQLTGEVTDSSVTLTFDKVGDYTNYKIYYAPENDDNLAEKDVTLNDGQTKATVTIDWLTPNTKYKFIAKAFDDDGNPVEATTSDPIYVTTKEQMHQAPSDNVIYNPVVKVEWNKIIITWKAGADVDKVQISISNDGKIFKPVATVDGKAGKYVINAKTTGKKYIKLVPIASDGTLGVCKVGTTNVQFVTANVQPKKEATKKIWHPKTGPETYLLFILALIVALGYVYRKRNA